MLRAHRWLGAGLVVLLSVGMAGCPQNPAGEPDADLLSLCNLFGCDFETLCEVTGEPFWCDQIELPPPAQPIVDTDGDQIPDSVDNCLIVPNAGQEDCDEDGVGDACAGQPDCNENGIPDNCDILDETSADCHADGVPDECQLLENDCNLDEVPDDCQLVENDCNEDQIPDDCQLVENDCNEDSIPDDCQLVENDCNEDSVPDDCQLVENDCNVDGVPDDCQLDDNDCNENLIPDDCELTENDCNADQIPDDCQLDGNDCNFDDIPDDCQLLENDCNEDQVPDDCQLVENDCNLDGIPDDCQLVENDCNEDWIPDDCQLVENDCNGDYIPDDCQLVENDCNKNLIPDDCELTENDCNADQIPDDCQLVENDCNFDGIPDDCQLVENDCNDDQVPDDCQLVENDCNGDYIPDDCQLDGNDCNLDGIPDDCQLVENDCNEDWIPDDCQLDGNDCNGNGYPDDCDIADLYSDDCQPNGVPDECDVADGTSADCQGDEVPDECQLVENDCNGNGSPDECDLLAEPAVFYADLVPHGQTLPGPLHIADDLHFAGGGLLESFDVGYVNAGSAPAVMTIDFYVNVGDEVAPQPADWVAGWAVVVPPGGPATHHVELVEPLAVPDDVWLAVRTDSASVGALYSTSMPTAGASHDWFYNFDTGEFEAHEGPEANLVLAAVGTRPAPYADCDVDGVPDDCQISDDPSLDCNENGVLDSCEIGFVRGTTLQGADACADAPPLCYGVAHAGSTVGRHGDGAPGCVEGGERSPDVWYRYSPAWSGTLYLSLCGSSYDTVLSVHTGCPGRGENVIACNDDGECGAQSGLSLGVCAGMDYYIRIGGYAGEAGDYVLSFEGPDCLSRDCNGNGVLDECDIGFGGSADCQANGIPDECEADCDGNGVPDECEPDCNLNGIPDPCDIMYELSDDCQPDGVPDDCQLGEFTGLWTNGLPNQSGYHASQSGGQVSDWLVVDDFLLPQPQPVAGVLWFTQEQPLFLWSGRVRLEIYPDNGAKHPDESGGPALAMWVPTDGGQVERFGFRGDECPTCPADQLIYVIYDVELPLGPGRWWIGLAPEGAGTPPQDGQTFWATSRRSDSDPLRGGEAHLRAPSAVVPLPQFTPLTQVIGYGYDMSFLVFTLPAGTDCNDNGTPDDCDDLEDCNQNGQPDICEEFADCNYNWIPDECESLADCDGNQTPDECEVHADCNENGIPDVCEDLEDCDGNEVPDACEAAPCDQVYGGLTDFATAPIGYGRTVADDLRMASGGRLCAFDVSLDFYDTPRNITVSFYAYAESSDGPYRPDQLLASFALTNLPYVPIYHYTVADSIVLPQNVWMEVAYANTGRPLAMVGPPTHGTSADLYYDRGKNQIKDFTPDGGIDSNFVLGVYVSGDCDGNGRLDACEDDLDQDGVIDSCDACPADPEVQADLQETGYLCYDGIDNDCDGLADFDDPDCDR